MKTTKNWSKVLFFGMAAMALAFGLVVTGCDPGYTARYLNLMVKNGSQNDIKNVALNASDGSVPQCLVLKSYRSKRMPHVKNLTMRRITEKPQQ